jgi:hypothetical protein
MHSVTSGAVYSALDKTKIMNTVFSEGSQNLSEVASHFRYILVKIFAGSIERYIFRPVDTSIEFVQNTGSLSNGQQSTSNMFYFASQITFQLQSNYSKIAITASAWNDPNFKAYIREVWGVGRIN